MLLGATSIDEALAGIETLERATDRNRRLVTDLSERLKGLRAAEARLATERVALTGAIAAAAAAERAAAAQVQSKRAYLAALQRERSLTDARLRDPPSARPGGGASSARLTATAATAPTPAEKPLLLDDTSGTQTMVVDAVAGHHLPGRTASLPVGPGVVAVDPAVIPLDADVRARLRTGGRGRRRLDREGLRSSTCGSRRRRRHWPGAECTVTITLCRPASTRALVRLLCAD